MPTKASSKKQLQNSSNDLKKKKVTLKHGIIGIILLIIAGLVFYWSFGERMIEKTQMESYLKDKYGQEFVVEDVHVTGTGLGMKGAWTAEAYPKLDSSIKFRIDRSQTTDTISVDQFLEKLWSKQGSAEVEAFLAEEFPNNEGYVLKITPGSPVSSWYKSIQGETPNLAKVLKEHPDHLSYSLSVRDVVMAEGETPSTTQLNNALKVVNFVKSKGATSEAYINYGYRDASYISYNHAGQQRYQYQIKLERDELQNINTSDDLRRYFEVIKYLGDK